MSNFNKTNGTIEISKAVIGCTGAVLAAIIGGIFLLISSGVIDISFSSPNNEPTVTPAVVVVTETPNPDNDEDCVIATRLPPRFPVVGKPWILPSGGWIHLNFWSNEPGIDQTEHKILLGPDDPRAFLGGGSAWQFPDECESAARANFLPVPLPEISLEELQSQNLVVR